MITQLCFGDIDFLTEQSRKRKDIYGLNYIEKEECFV